MKNKLRITAILLILGSTLSLGGCGWLGCDYHSHSYSQIEISEKPVIGNYV